MCDAAPSAAANCTPDRLSTRVSVVEASFTGADILLATCLGWAERLDVSLMAELQDYLERTTSRPAYRLAHLANQRT